MNFFVFDNKKLKEERRIAIHHLYRYTLETEDDVKECKRISKEYREYLFDFMKNHKKWWYKYWHKEKPKEIQIDKPKNWNNNIVSAVKNINNALNIYEKKVPYLNLMATSFCNLNCKGCGALMPLYNLDKEKKYMDLNALEKCLKRYNELFYDSYVDTIDIVGGEPLLHPQISELCRIVRKYNPKSKISILTNGIMVDKMKDEFFKTLMEENIYLYLSIYGEGIYFEKMNFDLDTNDDMNCSKCSGHLPIINMDNLEVNFGGVQLIEDGTLYYCAFAGVKKFNEFFGFNVETQKGYDYVNIFEVDSKEEVLKMFQQEKCPFSKYCSKRDLFEWDVSTCDIYEWVKN